MTKFSRTIRLGRHDVGDGHPCYVIAEAGVNHNGEVGLALELVRAAKEAGASCVKFQTFRADQVTTAAGPKAEYQLEVTDPEESQLRMLEQLELSTEDWNAILEECRKNEIEFLSTPYGLEDVDFLESLGVPGYKVASALTVETPLVRHIARTGKPVIASTGMCTLFEVESAVEAMEVEGASQLVLLQCTTNYPSDPADANLRAMRTMGDAFGCLVGYSDHTPTSSACVAAVALGACVIEKHLTLEREMKGPDHASSLEPDELADLVRSIREVESALGDGRKRPSGAEARNIEGMRRSIVPLEPIPAGTRLKPEVLGFKRPAVGIPPSHFDAVVGRRARTDLEADVPIQEAMLEPPEPVAS